MKRCILTLFAIILVTGCRPSYEERRAEKERLRKAVAEEQGKERQQKVKAFETTHQCIYFPPENIGPESFSYEIQRLLTTNPGQRIAFSVFLEDIVSDGKIIFAEYTCHLGDQYSFNRKKITLRLEISPQQLEILIERPETEGFSFSRFMKDPDSHIISTIDTVKRRTFLTIDGIGHADELEMTVENSFNWIATGHLVEIVPDATHEL